MAADEAPAKTSNRFAKKSLSNRFDKKGKASSKKTDEDDAEEDEENEAEGEDIPGGLQANAEPDGKQPAKSAVKHVSVEEARKQVQGVVRNWLSETVGQKPQ